MSAGYYASPWPAEDAGPARLQTANPSSGLHLQAGQRLQSTHRYTTLSTMTVLGDPGEVYLLTHSALRANVGLPTTSCVQRIDPVTLKTLESSGRLPGGPMWPGGMALHRNGDLYVVYGRYAHRLDRHCALKQSRKLPVDQPYNSFVILDNGLIVTKNLSDKQAAQLAVLQPEGLQSVCADVPCPEASIARLSAVGNTVYVVGVRSIFRFHWDEAAQTLRLDPHWRWDYIGQSGQSYGWDVVIDGHSAWFMDNGQHRYRINMHGAGVSRTANRLLRVSLADSAEHGAWEISSLAGGSITNPPLVDVRRRMVLGYDSANRFLRAWRFGEAMQDLQPAWHKPDFGVASHMVLLPERGQVVLNDYRRFGEEVVVLDIATGTEQGRVRVGGITQGVVFPSVGWRDDVYWCSMGRFSRVFAA
jgi:hypothetical protein